MSRARESALAMCVTIALIGLSGCWSADSPRGFTLPEGDVEKGRQTFAELGCSSCHIVAGADLPPADGVADFTVVLGGETTRVRTYGELVTSIIHPSHRIAEGYEREVVTRAGRSRMTIYNDVMTVTELTDLVTFLLTHYRVPQYVATDYPPWR